MDTSQDATAQLTRVLWHAHLATRSMMERTCTDLLNAMWLQFNAIRCMLRTGQEAVASVAYLGPTIGLLWREEAGRRRIKESQFSAFWATLRSALTLCEAADRQRAVAESEAATEAFTQAKADDMRRLLAGSLERYMEWRTQAEAACELQRWYRRRLLQQMRAGTDTATRERRKVLRLKLAATAGGLTEVGPTYAEFEAYERRFRRGRVPSSPNVATRRSALRRQVFQAQEEVDALRGHNAALQAAAGQYQAKQQKLLERSSLFEDQTILFRHQLANESRSFRDLETKLQDAPDLSAEITALRGENSVLSLLCRSLAREQQDCDDHVSEVEQHLQHRKEVQLARFDGTIQSVQRQKGRLRRHNARLNTAVAAERDRAARLRSETEAAEAERVRLEEAALAELEAAEAERNRLLRRLKSQERRLSAAQNLAARSFPAVESLPPMTFGELWDVMREVNLLHGAVCARICSKVICHICNTSSSESLYLPCEHCGPCARCESLPRPPLCPSCAAPVTGIRRIIVTTPPISVT